MPPVEIIRALDTHQQALSDLAGTTLAAIQLRGIDGPRHFGRLRKGLVGLLRRYQLFKHREIFNPVIAAGTPEQVRVARGMKASCIAAGESCRRFFRTWSARDLDTCYDSYAAAVRELIGGLRAHLAVERRAIVEALPADAPALASRSAASVI